MILRLLRRNRLQERQWRARARRRAKLWKKKRQKKSWKGRPSGPNMKKRKRSVSVSLFSCVVCKLMRIAKSISILNYTHVYLSCLNHSMVLRAITVQSIASNNTLFYGCLFFFCLKLLEVWCIALSLLFCFEWSFISKLI